MLAYWQLFLYSMSLHRLTHNVLRANGHVGNSLDAHRMVEGQEGLLEWEDPVD